MRILEVRVIPQKMISIVKLMLKSNKMAIFSADALGTLPSFMEYIGYWSDE